MFGGLFVAYAIFRNLHHDVFLAGSSLLDVTLGALNTLVLITSSLTMALAVHYAAKGKRDYLEGFLHLTITLAMIFLIIKYFEYSHKFHDGLLPGSYFTYADGPKNLALFFSLYFMLTGLHGIHILVGIGLMRWLIKRSERGDFSPENYTAIEGVGLYWHVVDIIWIYLFPLLYLVA